VAGGKVELVTMEGADDLASAADAFGKRALTVWTAILRGKETSIPLPEYGNLFAFHDVAAALAKRDIVDAAQIYEL
jgi:hypothetical protein